MDLRRITAVESLPNKTSFIGVQPVQSHRDLHLAGPMLVLMFYGRHLESLGNFCARSFRFLC
jgi:hypothetical protein